MSVPEAPEVPPTGFLDRRWVPPAFFVATVASVFFVGLQQGEGYYLMLGEDPTPGKIVMQAVIYTLALIAILGTHEMGHWLTSRAHGVKTSLPVFIPMPLGMGTFGAVIAMRQLPPDRTTLLRIGAAGPLAGGVIALALMAYAVATCPVVEMPQVSEVTQGSYIELGNSLGTILFSVFSSQEIPPGHDIAATPLFMAAWVGFLLTSFNLFPIGQLDGGHIAYALFGERMNRLSPYLALGVMGLSLLAIPLAGGIAPQYVVWGLLLRFLVAWHPPVPYPEPRLGRGTAVLVAASVILFLLTFMPAPMRFVFW